VERGEDVFNDGRNEEIINSIYRLKNKWGENHACRE
jgi:hypothetical protein